MEETIKNEIEDFNKINLEKDKIKPKVRVIMTRYENSTSMKEWNLKIKDTTEKMAVMGYFLKDTKEISKQDDVDYLFLLFFEKEQ